MRPARFVRTVATPLSFEADLLVVDESRRALDGFSLLSSPLPDSPLAQAEELPPNPFELRTRADALCDAVAGRVRRLLVIAERRS